MQAYLFQDYWEDIGTIEAFYHANLALTAQPDSRALGSEYYEGYAGEVVLGTSGVYPANPTGANAYYPVPLGGRSADQHDDGPFAHTTAYAEPSTRLLMNGAAGL